ncbi:MAG: glucose-phosphate cytidylyltransferase [Blastocatellia bacterium]|jgi:glucose-1-phosphate cytidylyltransferase|nr:glucose-phosphate cytidylyltransferase [Blastocatellia bacterium]
MKVAILAGGLGSRLAEETELKPKPMVEIGGRPILWHIMKHYGSYGFREFFIALGYKGEEVKRYFLDYHNLSGSMSVHLATGKIETRSRECEDWLIHLMDTGMDTHTGGRVKRLEPWLKDDTFMVTYGDGVGNINLDDLIKFHRSHGRVATVTAVRPPARFGGLEFDGDVVVSFTEKPQIGEGWINGGFMVFEPAVFSYLEDDHSSLEADAMERLAADNQLVAYRHGNFWQCMDTMRDMRLLQSLWTSGNAPWKVWD